MFYITFRSTALAILKSTKGKQAMRFRGGSKNETPLRMMIQYMPGKFGRTTVYGYAYIIIMSDGRFGRTCTVPVYHRRRA